MYCKEAFEKAKDGDWINHQGHGWGWFKHKNATLREFADAAGCYYEDITTLLSDKWEIKKKKEKKIKTFVTGDEYMGALYENQYSRIFFPIPKNATIVVSWEE